MHANCLKIILVVFGTNFYQVSTYDDRQDGDPMLREYLQPNHITNGEYDFLSTKEAEEKGICTRPCEGSRPMVCYYSFTLENYATVGPACGNCTLGTPSDCNKKYCVTADGFERAILSINRQLPGPSIQVCLYDTVIIDVHNKMIGKTVTIHSHGLYQRYTPFMDGVEFVTQCPILHHTRFRYKYPAIPDGSFFYHSHIGVQKMDGLEGSLIIREPKSIDKTAHLWDYDLPSHVIIITDWMHDMTDQKLPGFSRLGAGSFPDSYLINGKNNYNGNGTSLNAPYSQFNVKKNNRYRFRIIGGSCLACPYIFTIEKHKMLLIATDGTYTKPEEFDSITMVAGDRMDVVINANVGNDGESFWINVRSNCAGLINNTAIHAEAILHYQDGDKPKYQAVPQSERPDGATYGRGKSLNAGDVGDCEDPNSNFRCMSHVDALEPPYNSVVLKAQPDFQLVVGIDFHTYDEESLFWNDEDKYHHWDQPVAGTLVSAVLNNRSFVFPPFALLTQINRLPIELQCPEQRECRNDANSTDVCECTHVLKYEVGSVGELIFIDMSPNGIFYHPMHLHGNDMHIIEQGKIPRNYTGDKYKFAEHLKNRMKILGPQLAKDRPTPCVKDTLGNIPGGYSIVRVHFNNPGFWFLHCHFIFHTDTGMGILLQIGDKYQMRDPPAFFPRCNNYLPPVYPEEFDNFLDDERTKRKFRLDNQ